jgi:hypothetical protein
MNRFCSIAILCTLATSLAALSAGDDHKNAGPSQGHPMQPPGPVHLPVKGPQKPADNKEKGHPDAHHPKNPPKAAKKLPKGIKPHSLTLEKIGQNPNVSPAAKNAIQSALAGEFLNAAGRQDLTNLLAGNPAGLTEDERKAVQAVLDYDGLAKKQERYIQIENATGERLTVWLHYQFLEARDEWEWLPTKPIDEARALKYVVEPNTKAYLTDGKVRIAAGRARLWAQAESGYQWNEYRDQDLQLQPARDRSEVREMGTYPLRLVNKDNVHTQVRR